MICDELDQVEDVELKDRKAYLRIVGFCHSDVKRSTGEKMGK